jgi:hypothetical protein
LNVKNISDHFICMLKSFAIYKQFILKLVKTNIYNKSKKVP